MTTETGSTNLGDLSLVPVTDLALSVRAKKCTTKLGIVTIEELINTDAATLLKCKNFATGSLKEIRDRLAERGLKLKGE